LSLTEQTLFTTGVPPSAVPLANVQDQVVERDAEAIEVNTLGDTTGSKILVFATPSMSQGTTFVKNKLRSLGSFAGSDGATLDVRSRYIAKFGSPVLGANIYFGVKVINSNGQASPIETVKASVLA